MAFRYYAVKRGADVGIYNTWAEIVPLVNGYPGAVYKGFKSHEEAQAWMCGPMPKWVEPKQRKKPDQGYRKKFKYASMKGGRITQPLPEPEGGYYRGSEPPWEIE